MPGPQVFITYRREETAAHAGRLYDAMVARFGEGNVFMDVDMAPGVDFVERITEAVAACQVLIAVMGPRWATVEDEQGRPRIADPEDFVRLEVETALQRPDVTPIPVLVSGARMPSPDDLPPELRAITRRNALELSDQRWRYDVSRLISTLDELLAGIVPGPPSPERSVATGNRAPANAAQAAGETAPLSTAAATTSVETKRAPWLAVGGRRLLRWALFVAIAIAAIVAAVVLAMGWGGWSNGAGDFTEADLPDLVLTQTPGELRLSRDESGSYVEGLPGIDPDFLRLLSETNAQGYRNAFTAVDEQGKPYWYAESKAAVFEDEDAAQGALDSLEGGHQGRNVEQISVRGLGEDGFGVFVSAVPRDPFFKGSSWEGSDYHYAWRTGNLLQTFDLSLSGPGVSEETARDYAEAMDGLTER
jgi:TIR domain